MWAVRWAQRAEELAAKPGSLSSIPETDIVEAENEFVILSEEMDCAHMCVC